MTIKWRERGDTLVEVMMALAILSSVLISSFNLSSRALRLGAAARERSQGVNLIQAQAEALHSYRDSTNWAGVVSDMGSSRINFHMDPSGGWHPVNGPLTSGIYKVWIDAARVTVAPFSGNKYQFDVKANWDSPTRILQKTTITTFLVSLDNCVLFVFTL